MVLHLHFRHSNQRAELEEVNFVSQSLITQAPSLDSLCLRLGLHSEDAKYADKIKAPLLPPKQASCSFMHK